MPRPASLDGHLGKKNVTQPKADPALHLHADPSGLTATPQSTARHTLCVRGLSLLSIETSAICATQVPRPRRQIRPARLSTGPGADHRARIVNPNVMQLHAAELNSGPCRNKPWSIVV
jgi:hypothetical protein